ncbi:hypothetical protein, partial [Streptomyces sp. NPDC055134]
SPTTDGIHDPHRSDSTTAHHFHRIVTPIPDQRKHSHQARKDNSVYSALKADNACLRRDKRDLTKQLELAVAAVQRLCVDNDRLRTALHEAHSVTPLVQRPR